MLALILLRWRTTRIWPTGSANAWQAEHGLTEKRMFGGLAFLINGNMAVSASSQGGLLLRVDPADTEPLVREPHARRFEMRGREMDGWLRVDPDAPAAPTTTCATG